MTKKQLYFVIGVLAAVLLFVLFVPDDKPAEDQSTLQKTQELSKKTDETQEEENAVEISEVDEAEAADLPEQVTLEGEFLSLADGENQHGKMFKYMLLHDGVEVLRIDLRPLIGYSDIDVIQKLGVDRGAQVRVIGIMEDGEFKVSSIAGQ
tara:strand:- start:243 stop:695 length:453 start_codon:yes stop_codon:yes gene_type:complete